MSPSSQSSLVADLKALVKAQEDLLHKYSDVIGSMPFSISDVIEGYNEYIDEINELEEKIKLYDEYS